MTAPDEPRIHETGTAYNRKCRCETCVLSHRARVINARDRRAARRELIDGRWVAPLPAESHGKATTYVNHRCRCEPCVTANAKKSAKRRERYRRLPRDSLPSEKGRP